MIKLSILARFTMVHGTVEPLYCGHLGDLAKCPVYSGTPLMWTPWGPGEVSCIEPEVSTFHG